MNIIVPNPDSLAFESQFNQLLRLVKLMTHEIGYVVPVFYRKQAKEKKLLLLESGNVIVGFVSFNIRKKDGVGVIYEVATHPMIRGKGGGLKLIEAVLERCNTIQLKCPVDNKSNGFYKKIGNLVGTEAGKKRALNVWQLTTKTVKG